MITNNEMREIFVHLNSVSEEMSHGDAQFMMSLDWQFQNKGDLSGSQVYHLERLNTKYNMEELSKRKQFEQDYTDGHRLIALRCAMYYDEQHPRYYGNIVDKVLADPKAHVLGFNEFNKMCNNKYAKKILAAYDEQSRYLAGDMVQIRATNRLDIANTRKKEGYTARGTRATWRLADKLCMILEVDSQPITRAAKGARIYKILITDETSPIYAHESDLKKVRRSKKK